DAATLDIVGQNIEQLKELFPEVFTEGKVDFDALREALGDYTDDRPERYSFTWNGKSRARRIAQTPSTGTLRPCPEESVNWDTTQNLFIEGDNLEVLKLLQKSYHKKVKMIYIDPPYNTGKDFIYPDDFRDNIKNYLDITGQTDGEGRRLSTNAENSGRYHTDWLNMMYPRLKLARNLLTDDGVIFISIDDNEVANLRKVCDEVFGEENFICTLIWNKQHSQQQGLFKKYHEYVLLYARNESVLTNIGGGEGIIEAGALKKISRGNPKSSFTFPAGVKFEAPDGVRLTGTFGDSEKVSVEKGVLEAKSGKTTQAVTLAAGWTQKDQMTRWFSGEEVYDTKGQRVIAFYFNSAGKLKCRKERTKITPPTILPQYGMVSEQTSHVASLFNAPVFDRPKPVQMMQDFITWFADDGDVLLDFFAGSCTLCEAAMKAKVTSRFIAVQLPEPVDETTEAGRAAKAVGYGTIAQIGQERIRRVIKRIEAEQTQKTKNDETNLPGMADEVPTLDLGFKVFKLNASNIIPWDADFDNLETALFNAVENIKPDRTQTDVLYELLLKYGLDLAVPIEEREISEKTVYIIGAGALIVCLAKDITLDVVEGIAALKDELKPEVMRVVFKDSGFKDDVVKTNTVQTLRQAGIEDVKSL
ncbi:MAG: site-specific DNA-methyltransferase, partial [Deltaproteobacteria bacterium]|nr:site-specific DNA-methyltransferase [Deltaproteobacteria bacterium]